MLTLEATLAERVVGQRTAVSAIARALRQDVALDGAATFSGAIVITVVACCGGVGKSTFARELAATLAHMPRA